ncbi:hypothetical protein F442_10852 [Phytophthora nicotianae P10297]|uniref:Uncharacterized protein n=1 Tax=Phytophthora nicotianae P10297 TaxID=1317064 RepID=W2Z4F4_PHYNI|nr:hypothetical protein F442_10852 [Phytophthora nicotianae P10297]
MGSRRVFPLSVDVAPSTSANRSQPPPPKSPVHRPPTGHGSLDLARPPTGGSVGYQGFDRLMMMRQVNAAAPQQVFSGGDEASAAVNHRQRMAAEQQRRMELTLMAKEDYTGTPEGQERLQRQEERSRMREEELLVIRLVEAEKEAARKLQREKELEEEKRIKEQYLAKIRAQREQQEKEAKEKEEKRKAEMERKMKALKEAADAKARAEFAEKQHAIEEEARIAREKHQIELETVQMQVEDVLGHAMQQEVIAERERQRQIAAEQEEWRLFQEREQEKQREATQLRRAAMAQQYEQDKQRRIQIHKLQKERAAQIAERMEMQNRQVITEETKADEVKSIDQDSDDNVPVTRPIDQNELKDESSAVKDESSAVSSEIEGNNGEVREESGADVAELSATSQSEKRDITVNESEKSEGGSKELISGEAKDGATLIEQEAHRSSARGDSDESNTVVQVAESTLQSDQENEDSNVETAAQDSDAANTEKLDEPVAEEQVNSTGTVEKKVDARLIWTISRSQEEGFAPFAQVLSVTDSSPAMQATLKSGDLLVEFGGIVSTTPKCLMAMAECVQKNVNTPIPVVLLRSVETQEEQFEELRVSLCPRKWEGKGLLGCQLSPFKWPEKQEPAELLKSEEKISTESTADSSTNEGASALVVYDIVPASTADQAGLLNGDILAGCEGLEISVSVDNLNDVVGFIQAKRAACLPMSIDINRWIEEDQCYRSLRIELPTSDGPLGFALTSFAEYYNYYSSTAAAVSACEECYYTALTTALHAAALSGHVSCLEALLNSLQNGDGGGYSASDYLDWRDEDGRTPLFYACYAGQLECVKYLLKSVVNAGVDLYGDTVLHAATTSGNTSGIALLIESGCAKVDDKNHTRLTCAHIAPNVETLTFLGEQCEADLLATDTEERMPLAYACLRNDVESIHYLCKKHPDFVDYADVRGNTPLHVAAWLGLQEAVEVLITYLPSIALYITNEDGQNAAELARSNGKEEVAAFLDSVMAAAETRTNRNLEVWTAVLKGL